MTNTIFKCIYCKDSGVVGGGFSKYPCSCKFGKVVAVAFQQALTSVNSDLKDKAKKIEVGDIATTYMGRYLFVSNSFAINGDENEFPYYQINLTTYEVVDALPESVMCDLVVGDTLVIGGKISKVEKK